MRLESLHIKNYGCLADLELTDLPPLAIFVGANGSGEEHAVRCLRLPKGEPS